MDFIILQRFFGDTPKIHQRYTKDSPIVLQ
nr:MAG TPA: hypothetical protein [Caudoviricetes sp.]